MTWPPIARNNRSVDAARSSITNSTDPDHADDVDSSSYTREVGLCLRKARQHLGLSLQAVESLSSQEFKASVLGAYERGERSISVPRLQRLAILYKVPVDLLLPQPEPPATPSRQDQGPHNADLDTQLNTISGPEREILRRFIKMIQAQRRESGARGPSAIRSEDLRAIELLLGSSRTDDQPGEGHA